MTSPTLSTDAAHAQVGTAPPRWSQSRQSELNALQSGQWWPFKRADPKVLEYLHKKHKQDIINNAERAWL
jgi:hypothetical protein